MGIFNFKKKKDKKEAKQNAQETYDNPRKPFLMHLLMREKCEMPSREQMCEIMEKHLGEVDCFNYDHEIAAFDVKKYKAELKDSTVYPRLVIKGSALIDTSKIDETTRSQMWDCPESEEILESCKYHVVGIDGIGAGLDYKERAELLMDFLEALVEMFPMCEAVFFQNSGKLIARDKIIGHKMQKERRYIYFVVNIRFFNIHGTDELIVDTVGMGVLHLPNLQYHFQGMDSNLVVAHANNTLYYIFDNECPIHNGDTIDGILNEEVSKEVQWECQYEISIIPPERVVIDICMNEFASGNRE